MKSEASRGEAVSDAKGWNRGTRESEKRTFINVSDRDEAARLVAKASKKGTDGREVRCERDSSENYNLGIILILWRP